MDFEEKNQTINITNDTGRAMMEVDDVEDNGNIDSISNNKEIEIGSVLPIANDIDMEDEILQNTIQRSKSETTKPAAEMENEETGKMDNKDVMEVEYVEPVDDGDGENNDNQKTDQDMCEDELTQSKLETNDPLGMTEEDGEALNVQRENESDDLITEDLLKHSGGSNTEGDIEHTNLTEKEDDNNDLIEEVDDENWDEQDQQNKIEYLDELDGENTIDNLDNLEEKFHETEDKEDPKRNASDVASKLLPISPTVTIPSSPGISSMNKSPLATTATIPKLQSPLVMKNNSRIVFIQGADGKTVPIKVINNSSITSSPNIIPKTSSSSTSSSIKIVKAVDTRKNSPEANSNVITKTTVFYPKVLAKKESNENANVVVKSPSQTTLLTPQANKTESTVANPLARSPMIVTQAQKLGLIQANKLQQVLNLPRPIKTTTANIVIKPAQKVSPTSSPTSKPKTLTSQSKLFLSQPTMVGNTLITKTISSTQPNKLMLPVKLTTSAAAEVTGTNSATVPSSQLQAINIPGKGVHYVRLINNTQIATSNRGPPRILNSLLTPPVTVTSEVTTMPTSSFISSVSTPAVLTPSATETSTSTTPFPGKKFIVQKKIVQKQQFALVQSGTVLKNNTTTEGHSLGTVSKMVTTTLPPKAMKQLLRDTTLPVQSIQKRSFLPTNPATKFVTVVKRDDSSSPTRITSKVTKLTSSQLNQLQGKPHSQSLKDTKVVMLSGNYKQQPQPQKNTSAKENTSTNQQVDNSINNSPTSSLVNETKKMKIETDNSNDTLTEDLAKPKTNADESLKKRPCNCTKSQCLKLYCECFANADFCSNCNCKDCFNNPTHIKERHKAIRLCLERNPAAFKPKIGTVKDQDRKHTKGCNCKRSGCLKNYCECYEAKIPCSGNCKCFGCKNTEEGLMHISDSEGNNENIHFTLGKSDFVLDSIDNKPSTSGISSASMKSPGSSSGSSDNSGPSQKLSSDPSKASTSETKHTKPYNFMTPDVIEATVQCMIAQADECQKRGLSSTVSERMILEEFGRCLVEIIEFSKQKDEDDDSE